MKLAEVHLKLESKHDAASSWVEASKAFLKSDQRREWWGRPRLGCCCGAVAGLRSGCGLHRCMVAEPSLVACHAAAHIPAVHTCVARQCSVLQERWRACSRRCRYTPTWGGWAWPHGSCGCAAACVLVGCAAACVLYVAGAVSRPRMPYQPHPARAPTLAVCQEIGEVLEKEGNKEEAIMFYEQAADLFATENSTSEANKCNLKVHWTCDVV